MIILCSVIFTLITWKSLERNDFIKEPSEVNDEQLISLFSNVKNFLIIFFELRNVFLYSLKSF